MWTQEGFYAALLILPPALYFLNSSAPVYGGEEREPLLTRMIHKFDGWLDWYKEQNYLHAQLEEQAAADRILFKHYDEPAHLRYFKMRNDQYVSRLFLH